MRELFDARTFLPSLLASLLSAALLSVTPAPAAQLDTHTVELDGSGKIVPWTADPADGYDHVVALSWDLIANAMPIDPANGLPVTYTHSEYDPDDLSGSGWPNNPAGKHAMLADAATMLYAYTGDPAVIELVRGLLDHQLDHGTTPANYTWAKVPWSTAAAGSVDYGDDALREGAGVLEPDKVGELGYHGYLRFYELTGDSRYRDAAIDCADALAANIRPPAEYSADVSPWPFRVVAHTGAIAAGEELCGDVVAPVRLFDELIRLGLGDTSAYAAARAAAWSWIMDYGIPDNAWANYFEDVGPVGGSGNINQYNAGQTARYLLEHPEFDPDWQTHAAGLIAWVEDNFGDTDNGESGTQFGARVITEQDAYRYKMASHTSRYAAVNALYYARTGDAAAKEKAYRSLNWATYMCRSNGVVIEGPAEFAANPPAWFTDGHGDYMRHFLLAMGAVPEWVPAGENHLVGSTSVVPWVQYAPSGDAVAWHSFDSAATETLRLAFAPASVLAGGVALPQRSDLAAEGWVYDAASGVLRVRHDVAADVQVIAGTPGNLPPSVTLTAPVDAATYEAPADIALAADASDSDGSVARVDFYDGTTLVFTDFTAPFEGTWYDVAAGSHRITAYARDDAGAVVGSQSAAITVSAPGLPAPWQDTDVGDVGAAGSASYYAGEFTVTGSGVDIWNTADEFHFVHQTLSGDFDASARVVSVGDTGPWSMAGIMVRNGLGAGAKHAVVAMTHGQGESFTWRETTGGSSSYQPGDSNTAPAWLMLRRQGDQLTALHSSDGTSWTAFATATVSLPAQVTVGLAVSAVNDGALNTSTFDNVTIGPVGGGGTIPDVSIDPAVIYQQIDGFGVNANHRSWRDGELIPVLDRLIDEAGMGLFRVVFDNSDWEATNDNADPAVMNQGYYDSVYGSSTFEPLWQMATYLNTRDITDGLVFCFMGPGPDWMGGTTLDPGMEDEWAEMIVSLLLYARDVRGIEFHLVAPNNEPDIFNEGIHTADGNQYTAALHALAERLDAEGLGDVRLVAPDRAGGGIDYLPEMLADPVVMAKVAHVGLHSYSAGGGGSGGVADYLASSAYPDRSFWMTELNVWCPTCDAGVPGSYDWAYTRGTAEYLLDHLANGASAGIVWEGYDSSYAHHAAPWSFWGLLRVDDIDSPQLTYTPRKNFYTVAQISRFVAAGDLRVGVSTTQSGLELQAFARPSTGGLALVGLNDDGGARTLTVDVSAFPAVTELQLVQTTSSLSLDYGPLLAVTDGQVAVTVAGDSVFTLTSEPIGAVASCPATPSACRQPISARGAKLTLRKGSDGSRDRLSWSWKHGQAVSRDELGDPITADAYELCLYDAGQLVDSWVAPAGESCGGSAAHPKPCWRSNARGIAYKDKTSTPDGLAKVKVKASDDDGRASASVSGKGSNLSLVAPDSLAGPLEVQLRRQYDTLCVGASFNAPFAKQSAKGLSARSD